jgi:hypothetical protein
MHCQFYEGPRKPKEEQREQQSTSGSSDGPETDLNAVQDMQSAVELDAIYSQPFADDDTDIIEGFIDADDTMWSSDEEDGMISGMI